MDFELTQKYYDDNKQKYEKKGDQIEWENWNKRVKDTAGNWNQNPHDRETTYPLKRYWRLARVRAKDGKEYLETRAMWIGVNAFGDEQPIGVVDPEMFIETKWNHRRVQDPKDRNNIISEPFGVASQVQKHKPESVFDPDKAREYYGQPHEDGCNLVVRNDTRDGSPVQVLNFEDFITKSFDELMYGIKPTIVSNERTSSAAASKAKQ
jgi:hypothetical protein